MIDHRSTQITKVCYRPYLRILPVGMMLVDEAAGGKVLFSFYDKDTGPIGTNPKIVICMPRPATTPSPGNVACNSC